MTSISSRSLLCAGGLILILVVAACSPRETPETPVEATPEAAVTAEAPDAVYSCEGGGSVAVAYPDPSRAQLTRDGKVLSLTAAQAASGARYVGDGVEWGTTTRGTQETGVLTRIEPDGQPGPVLERCSRPAPAPVTPPPCVEARLRLALEGGDAGMGNRVNTLSLTNTGPTACVIGGYPTVTVLDGAGAPLANVVTERGPDNYFNNGGAPRSISLKPGARAVFDLAWNVVPHEAEGETVCPTAKTVRVNAPGDATSLDLTQTFTPCGGRVKVGPLRAGDATPG